MITNGGVTASACVIRLVIDENRIQPESIGPAGSCSGQNLAGPERFKIRFFDCPQCGPGKNPVCSLCHDRSGNLPVGFYFEADRRLPLNPVAACNGRIFRKRGQCRNSISIRVDKMSDDRRILGARHKRDEHNCQRKAANAASPQSAAIVTLPDPHRLLFACHRFRFPDAQDERHPCTSNERPSLCGRRDSILRR